MAKHTPGPWAADGLDVKNGCGHMATTPERIGPDGEKIGEANARLIAAAPDLLAACQAALPILTAYIPPENFDGHAAKALAAVTAAVSKATGGS